MDVQPIPVGRRFFFTMLGIATGISLISIVFSFFDPEQVTLKIIFFLFNTESENNIPTWFSAGLWLFLGIAVLLVRAHTERYRASWLVFAVVAMLASLDEFSRLHERLEKIGRRLAAALSLEDVLHWAWVLVGLIIVVFVAVTLTPLVFRLPKTIRNGILLSGFIFVLGAVGFETLGGLARKYEMPIVYILLQHTEELLEMTGVSLAVASVLEMLEFRRTEEGFETSFRGYKERFVGRRLATE